MKKIEDKEFCLKEFDYKKEQVNLLVNCTNKTSLVKKKYANNEITYLTWNKLDELLNKICKKIENKYVGVYGIPRAGLLLATIISYKTGLPLLSHAVENCLVVDDAVSSGVAMLPYIKRYDTFAVVVDKYSPYLTTYYCYNTEELIYFPWDKKIEK